MRRWVAHPWDSTASDLPFSATDLPTLATPFVVGLPIHGMVRRRRVIVMEDHQRGQLVVVWLDQRSIDIWDVGRLVPLTSLVSTSAAWEWTGSCRAVSLRSGNLCSCSFVFPFGGLYRFSSEFLSRAARLVSAVFLGLTPHVYMFPVAEKNCNGQGLQLKCGHKISGKLEHKYIRKNTTWAVCLLCIMGWKPV